MTKDRDTLYTEDHTATQPWSTCANTASGFSINLYFLPCSMWISLVHPFIQSLSCVYPAGNNSPLKKRWLWGMWPCFGAVPPQKARNVEKTHQMVLQLPQPRPKKGEAIASERASWLSRCVSNCFSSDRKLYLTMGWKHRKSISACLKFQHCVLSHGGLTYRSSTTRSWYTWAISCCNLALARTPHTVCFCTLMLASRSWQMPSSLHNPCQARQMCR